MGPGVVNRNKDSNFYGPYAGRDQYIIMLEDKERKFVVTHNANIKPVSYFTGRETELKELRQRIEQGRKSVLVSGMGGIGKTHICRKLFEEYLKKHADGADGPFQHIGYVEYNGDMGSSLQNCLKYKHQEQPEADQEAAWRELEYLASSGKLLLFVDNVNVSIGEDAGLERLKQIPGAVVLTSRRTAFGKVFELYRIGFLNTEQCIKMYESIRYEDSGKKVPEEEIPDLEYIIENMAAGHTITIEFLAHLAETKQLATKELRNELKNKGFRLKYKDEEDKIINIQEEYEKLYDLSVLTEAERNILEAFSIFPYIPLEAEICNHWLLSDAGVSDDDDILIGLYRKGWLQFDIVQESYAMHPVFAQFIYDKCKPNAEKHEGLIRACRNCLEIPDSGSPLECQRFIPFGENILEKMDMVGYMASVGFMYTFAKLLGNLGQHNEVKKLYNRVLEILRGKFGEDHSIMVFGYNNLAMSYQDQGEYKRAEELYKKSVGICERVLGEDHEETANSYNYLAMLYECLGEYEKAEELYIKSLNIRKKVFGENHKYTVLSYNWLAMLYKCQAKYEKAEELYIKSLSICKRVFGENHADTAIIYSSLASMYKDQGKYKKAEELYKIGIRISERVFGAEHPDTTDMYDNLAYVYEEQGEYEKAERLYEKGIEISERVLGKNHPKTAMRYNNLGVVYRKQGEYGKAEELYEKSLEINERVLGENHLETAMSYNNLGGLYCSQGEYEKAEELYEKSLRIRERVLGEDHPETAMSYNNLGGLYCSQGEYEKAIAYNLKASKIIAFKLGVEHPDTQLIFYNLIETYEKYYPEGNFKQWLQEKLKEEE